MTQDPPRRGVTRHLNMDDAPTSPPKFDTRPLAYIMPWVLEFRVVGTPSVVQVRVREKMLLGRSDPDGSSPPDIDLEAYDAYTLGVSRKHAQLVAQNNRITIQDIHSSNGTFLNDGRLEPAKHYRVYHGDRLTLGRLELQVRFVIVPSMDDPDMLEPLPEGAKVPVLGAGQHILVVEDDQQVAQTIRDVLTEVGFVVTVVDNLTDAMFAVAKKMPDAVVVEQMMPDGSGLDLVQYVRSREDAQMLPLVMVSSVSGERRTREAVEAGVDLFLTKPFGIDEFLYGFSQIVPHMRK